MAPATTIACLLLFAPLVTAAATTIQRSNGSAALAAANYQIVQAETAPASPSWVILGSVPRVAAADADLPPGADLSLALPPPPRVALLTIPPRIFAHRTTSDNFPSVVAADPSGLLLLHASQGRATDRTEIETSAVSRFHWSTFVPGYFVLDATTAASALPLPKPELILDRGHLGLISSPGGGGNYMVAELQQILGHAQAILLRFSSETGEWVTKFIGYPLPIPARQFAPNGVVSHAGRLWWVDLSWCLLTCDPFADAPVLTVVPLPEVKALKSKEAWGLLDKYRCVRVSGGKLRFVDMYSRNGTTRISVWTLADPDTREWKLEYEATFAEIWDDASYKSTGLPRKIPVLALIHPTNPDVVYFFLDEHLPGVDVRARKVVQCEVYELVAPPSEHVATRFIHAWQLSRALSSGSAKKTEGAMNDEL